MSSNGAVKRFLKTSSFYTLLVRPNFGCSTKEIYSRVKKITNSKFNNPKKLIETFKEYYTDIDISVEQLDIGDIIITNNYCNILIERKTICDVLASIKDGRWKNQKQRILDNYENCSIGWVYE